MLSHLAARLVRPTPPPVALGIAVGALLVMVETLLAYLVGRDATRSTMALVFLLGVVVISSIWGIRLALAMAAVSVAVYSLLYVPPVRDMQIITHSRDWLELGAFILAAVLAALMAQLARTRAIEAIQRRDEADLLAWLARHMLSVRGLHDALPAASRRLAEALRVDSAALELDDVPAPPGQEALPLRGGTLLLPAGLPPAMLRRLRERLLPRLDTLLRIARERDAMNIAVRELLAEQSSVRRVAELVAHGAPPADVVAAVAAEAAGRLDADATRLMRYEEDGTVSVIAEYHGPGVEGILGRRFAAGGGVSQLVRDTGRPCRVDSYERRPGPLADQARREGFRSSVATPILVEGRVWGALVVLWSRPGSPPVDTERRLSQFSELVAAAVANTESRTELRLSRARIVLAADQARRRIERDLHDGVQQRLVALGLQVRAAEAEVPADLPGLRTRLAHTAEGLTGVFTELREISRGLHPAALEHGGLPSALRTLARRSPIPVTVQTALARRLPECVEVAAYYVASEALTNAAKHAGAEHVEVDVGLSGDVLSLVIRDDGIGGADPEHGSGLVGLVDRVEALGGRLEVSSPTGGGTAVRATLPADIEC